MILTCNCGKKFSPDNAILLLGECTMWFMWNKWKQFPVNETKEIKIDKKISTPKKEAVTKISKATKKAKEN